MIPMLKLVAKSRDIFGKKLGKARQTGQLPAVLYGGKMKNSTSLFVDTKDFKKVFAQAGESSVVKLEGDGHAHDVLIHEVAHDPVTDEPIHVDFYAIEAGKLLRVKVPLEFTGESPAVKSGTAVLVKVMHEIEVEAKPADLPHEIKVDISTLSEIGQQIKVSDLKAPTGVKILGHADDIVANLAAPREEKEEEAPPADISQIEISEERGKKEDEGEVPTENVEKK